MKATTTCLLLLWVGVAALSGGTSSKTVLSDSASEEEPSGYVLFYPVCGTASLRAADHDLHFSVLHFIEFYYFIYTSLTFPGVSLNTLSSDTQFIISDFTSKPSPLL